MKKILVIDDDIKLCSLLEDYLSQYGFSVKSVHHPEEGLNFLNSQKPDLIILDVMLPGMDGFSVLKMIREKSEIPVVMLTARGDTTDRIVGLEIGADDYLAKPFEPRELVARMQSILWRLERTQKQNLASASFEVKTFGSLKIDCHKRQVFWDQSELRLSAAEFDLLNLLSSEPGKKWSRDEIMNSLHGIESEALSRSIDIMISRIRYKISAFDKNYEYIKTIRGTGYCFVGASHE